MILDLENLVNLLREFKHETRMTLENFMCPGYIWMLGNAICDKFGFYIADDVFEIVPLDNFVRYLPDDKEVKYWLWSTVDYHC